MKRKIKVKLLLTHFMIFMPLIVWARAGGAGGGGESSSSDHGAGDFLFDIAFYILIYLLKRPWGWGVIVILILVGYLYFRFSPNKGRTQNSSSEFYEDDGNAQLSLLPQVQTPLSSEQLTAFYQKVQIAFITIQKAWSAKNTTTMRRFITDGVYQRFNAQFTMMNLLDQTNIISQLRIQNIKVVNYIEEGNYECIDVSIAAEANDQFVSNKFPQFNSPGGRESFVEVWSFLRRKDCAHTADIFSNNQCPKCSAPLTTELMKTACCPYCGVYINNGEFDWVLSNIYQDYSPDSFSLSSNLIQSIAEVRRYEPDFSKNILEDRASNAFLQFLIGLAERDVKRVHRFSTDLFFQDVEKNMPSQKFIFNRLFISHVELTELNFIKPHRVKAEVNLRYAAQRVEIHENKVKTIDDDITLFQCKIILIHEFSDQARKGSIYANSCPSCGGTQKDSLNLVCEYCSSILNDPKGDWIVSEIMDENSI